MSIVLVQAQWSHGKYTNHVYKTLAVTQHNSSHSIHCTWTSISFLATKVFIGKLPATGMGIGDQQDKQVMNERHGPTKIVAITS